MNRPFEAQGGLFRDEAIMLLRRFYVQENERGVCFFFFFFLQRLPPLPPFVFRERCCVSPDGLELLANYLHLLVYMRLAPEPRPKKNRELVTDILPLTKDSLDTV